MPLCVFAYTPPGPTPPFINISRLESGDYRVLMRSSVADGMGISPVAEMILSREHVAEMYRSLLRDLLATTTP
jgi:hypothetical protein